MKARIALGTFFAAAAVVALALAFFVSPEASSQPDGLNKVAIDEGFASAEREHALADTPTAGYAVEGLDNERLSTGLAGIIGVAATFAATGAVFLALRARRRSPDSAAVAPTA